tara:strand:+ start:1272 stop:1997 length:726 start_codon:yes stop_codon:yes gene_type:complete
MNSYKLSIAYDGTNYYGFQKQKNKPTIQGKLEEALNLLVDSYELNYSGRTDAGVHAKSQIVNIKTDLNLDSKKISSINKILGDSISINSFKIVSSDFHARYGATERTYKYLVRDSKSNYPHLNKNTYQHYSLLNLEDLNKVAQLFIGEHNFSSFSKIEKFNNPERSIFSSKWIKKNEIYEYTIIANSFLRNMVRNIVGVQLAYCDQKLSLQDILNELKKPSGERLNFIAPAHGLILWKVKY